MTGLPTAALCVLALKRRWGKRPDADAPPAPSMRQPLSRSSDRSLLWGMWLFGGLTVSSTIELITGSDRSWWAALSTACFVWFTSAVWLERQRRRNTP